jgi:hypothetical protein
VATEIEAPDACCRPMHFRIATLRLRDPRPHVHACARGLGKRLGGVEVLDADPGRVDVSQQCRTAGGGAAPSSPATAPLAAPRRQAAASPWVRARGGDGRRGPPRLVVRTAGGRCSWEATCLSLPRLPIMGEENLQGLPGRSKAIVKSRASKGPNTGSRDWSSKITTCECRVLFAEPTTCPFTWSVDLCPVPTFPKLISKDIIDDDIASMS